MTCPISIFTWHSHRNNSGFQKRKRKLKLFHVGHPFAHMHRQRAQRSPSSSSSPAQGLFGLSPILLYAGLILISTLLSGLFFGGDNYSATSTFNDKNGGFWGSDVFQFQYSRTFSQPLRTHRSGVSYYVHPEVYEAFKRTEMPRYAYQPRLPRAPKESTKLPPNRARLLDQWVDRTWFKIISDTCAQEQTDRSIRIRQSQWFFGTQEGNKERRAVAEGQKMKFCSVKDVWENTGKVPSL